MSYTTQELFDMLMKRMEEHPDEFFQDWEQRAEDGQHSILGAGSQRSITSKWDLFISRLVERHYIIRAAANKEETRYQIPLPFFSDEQIAVLHDKYQEIQRQSFAKYMQRKLAEG